MADTTQNGSKDQNGSQGGMNVQVGAESPFGTAGPGGELPELGEVKKSRNLLHIAIPVVIVVLLLGLVYIFVIHAPAKTTTIATTIQSTTVPVSQSKVLSACGVIGAPGAYTLSSNIKANSTSAPCLNITSSNVAIACNSHRITGSGPFTGIGPFSYGVEASNGSNVSVSGCTISNFSYGVYAQSVSGLQLSLNNITTNYVSDFYMANSSGGVINNNQFLDSSSPVGSVIIAQGSTNNFFSNNTLKYNVFFGFNVSSTSNKFFNNYIIGSQFSFECAAPSGFPSSNLAGGNTCFNNTGCDFITCNGKNIPVNVSKIVLGAQVNSCGQINTAGSYSLSSDLDMKSYSSAPISTLAFYGIPCIKITAPDVLLNCNGHTITNAYAGIVATANNVTLRNCNVASSSIGILLSGVDKASISHATLQGNNVSLKLVNTLGAVMSNVDALAGAYGAYFDRSSANILRNFTANSNKLGIYVSNSYGNIFNSGTALNNSRFDVYATLDSANATANLMGSTACNVTDAQWATCAVHTKNTTFSFAYPISGCSTLKRPGTYSLTQNIINAPPGCMRINASNIALNCSNFVITGVPSRGGAAVIVNAQKNVSVANCGFANYGTGVQASNLNGFNFTNLRGAIISTYGVRLANARNGIVSRVSIRDTNNATIALDGVSNTTVINNNVSEGAAGNIAILVNNSSGNKILNNSGYTNAYGLYLEGVSQNNTISNNQFSTSGKADFYCDAQNSGINSESGGINTGTVKIGCSWLAAIPFGAAPLGCTGYTSPQVYSLGHDHVYGSGAICFTLLANNSQINCNGHTIIATQGGTLALFSGRTIGQSLINCNLKGFTTPVIMNGASGAIINNTFYNNASLLNPSAPAINITNAAQNLIIRQNRIISKGTGIYLNNVGAGKITSNNVTALDAAYSVRNTNTTQFTNDTATAKSGLGLSLTNSSADIFQNNNFYGVTEGLICSGSAQNKTENLDNGGNFCSLNSNCRWISSSASTCPP